MKSGRNKFIDFFFKYFFDSIGNILVVILIFYMNCLLNVF